MDATERLRSYRRYVYEAGGIKRADGRSSVAVDDKILEMARKTDFEISRLRRCQIPYALLFGLGDHWKKRVCCKKLQTL